MTLEVGTQIGDYRILSRIGRGAYGIVFEAEHIITQRVDALKVLLDACSPDSEQRFLREIQVQASLQHPNIAAVYHAFRSPAGLVLVMERVPGESLRAILDRGRPPVREGLRYILETLAGLDFAERAGVIHRDIKPENILITPEGGVKLTDFGLAHVINRARITGSDESLGTPLYISPEQIDGLGEVDARTDVYSTGVVLYEVVTGRVPFPGKNGYAVMRAHRETQPTPPAKLVPAIGERLNAVILRAMEKDPSKRFQSSADFQAALHEAAEPAPAAARSHGFRRRVRAAAIAALAIGSAALAGEYWRFRQHPHPPPQAEKAAERPATANAAKTPQSAPPIVEEPIGSEEAPAQEASPHEPARAKRVRPASGAKASRPKSLALRITGIEPGSAIGPASAPVPAKPPVPAVDFETPALSAPSPAPSTCTEARAETPPVSEPEVAGTKSKRRNVIVRALGKLFGKKATAPAGAPAANPHAKTGGTSAAPKPAP